MYIFRDVYGMVYMPIMFMMVIFHEVYGVLAIVYIFHDVVCNFIMHVLF